MNLKEQLEVLAKAASERSLKSVTPDAVLSVCMGVATKFPMRRSVRTIAAILDDLLIRTSWRRATTWLENLTEDALDNHVNRLAKAE